MKLLALSIALTFWGGAATLCAHAAAGEESPRPPAGASRPSAEQSASELPDTSRLPRVPGADEMFASPATTMYLAPESVAKTSVMVEKLLAAAGWQPYISPAAARGHDPNVAILSLKKGPLGLAVFVTIATAQGGKTSVSYTAVALEHDLPFPAGATDIHFDPNEPHLTCTTRDPLEKTLAVLEEQLSALGWEKSSAHPQDELTEQAACRYFVHKEHDPLCLSLRRSGGGSITVEVKRISPTGSEAESKAPAVKQPLPAP